VAKLRRGQTWILDLFFGLLVFTLALSMFFASEINLSDADETKFEDMLFESRLVTDSLMSRGYPPDWTPGNVTEIGITDEYRVNQTKIGRLESMNYSRTKSRLRTKYDYYLFFEGAEGVMRLDQGHEGMGKPGVNSTNIVQHEDPSNLVSTNRFVIFRQKPARMVVYLWD
jgi:hypothetical protein